MLNAHHQDDAPLGIKWIRLARRGREPKQCDPGRRRELDPGERRDLRRYQQRQQRHEGERSLAADIGQGQHEGNNDADHNRDKRRQRAHLDGVDQSGLRRRRAPLFEQCAQERAVAARQQRLVEQPSQRPDRKHHDVDRERDDQDALGTGCRRSLVNSRVGRRRIGISHRRAP